MRSIVALLMYVLFGEVVVIAIDSVNFYDTEEFDTNDGYCLYYSLKTHSLEYSDITHYSFFKFCLREFTSNDIFVHPDKAQSSYYRLFTFDQLRAENITDEMLWTWSAPIDLIERYEFYLNNHSGSGEQRYYHCIDPWFGPLCQFRLDIRSKRFHEQVQNAFQGPVAESDPSRLFLRVVDTCYKGIPCSYLHSLPVCLDWREICDGKIDCSNDGIDEKGCFELELNECDANEYRCHNGHCIPDRFYRDDPLNPDCLDGSDEVFDYSESCFFFASIRCEERQCRAGSESYPCGYGQCGHCKNGRNQKLDYTYINRPNGSTVNDACWYSLVVLTGMERLGTLLDRFPCPDVGCIPGVQRFCPPFFLYPAYPIAFGHVRFIYDNKANIPHTFRMLPPTYVCYDANLCGNYLPPTDDIRVENFSFTCRPLEQMPFPQSELYKRDWFILKEAIETIFAYCSSVDQMISSIPSCPNHPVLYQCRNSTKCISKHRLLDGIPDCHLNDDEQYSSSCSLDHPHRFACGGDLHQCPSPLLFDNKKYDCLTRLSEPDYYEYIEPIPEKTSGSSPINFQTLCDGFTERLPLLLNGENETDESHCEHWSCENMYTRCDGYWNCLNGLDEINCPSNANSICFSHEIQCVSPSSYSLVCLDVSKINDGHIDCLGAFDERQWCRTHFPEPSKRYQCLGDTRCIEPLDLCDGFSDCILAMDDDRICSQSDRSTLEERDSLCNHGSNSDYPYVNTNLCHLSDAGKPTEVYFKLTDAPQLSSKTMGEMSRDGGFEDYFDGYIRLCNRGVPIDVRRGNGSKVEQKCLCPPGYYGSFCQYQNQRVSLTIQFGAVKEWQTVFTFVFQLIDDHQPSTIHSYERLNYLAMRDCNTKFSFYLLYKTRPKDVLRNYSIRVDVYNAKTLEYRASWLYPIRFAFLPVHRLALQILVPIRNHVGNEDCSMNCGDHGRCVRYENTKSMFCRCDPGWEGQSCSVSYQCHCASFLQCIAPSICLCPMDQLGDRCFLQSHVCSNTSCLGNSLCVPSDIRLSSNHSFTCICAEGFWGDRCQFETSRVLLTFDRTISKPSSLHAHLITADGQSKHKQTTMLAKIPFDQDAVTLHITSLYHLIFIQINEDYYLISNQTTVELTPSHRCSSINEMFNSTIVNYHPLRRVKYYHLACKQIDYLRCFHDMDSFMCLCTANSEANCFNFDYNQYYDCQGNNYCENAGQCFQDRSYCPTTSVCVCRECFYGSQCQFSTEGFGLSLDAIIGYHIRPHTSFDRQTNVIHLSAIFVGTIFSLGMVGAILSLMTFSKKENRSVGCGIYLLGTSIVSFLVMIMVVVKFTSLLFFQMGFVQRRWLLEGSCRSIDFLLRLLFNTGDWLNVCVSTERVVVLIQRTSFNKIKSRKVGVYCLFSESNSFARCVQVAKRMMLIIVLITILTALQDPLHRELIDDDENRTWCIVRYTSQIQLFNSIMLMFHFLAPFTLNILFAFLIIFLAARQRSAAATAENYKEHLRNQFHEHKHMIISSFLLVLLASPRLVISFQVGCMNTTRDPWLLLIGYFISFIPPMLIFVVFILPSSLYKKSLLQIVIRARECLRQCCRHARI